MSPRRLRLHLPSGAVLCCFLIPALLPQAMAASLGVPITEHSFADTRLLFAARRLKVPMEGMLVCSVDSPLERTSCADS